MIQIWLAELWFVSHFTNTMKCSATSLGQLPCKDGHSHRLRCLQDAGGIWSPLVTSAWLGMAYCKVMSTNLKSGNRMRSQFWRNIAWFIKMLRADPRILHISHLCITSYGLPPSCCSWCILRYTMELDISEVTVPCTSSIWAAWDCTVRHDAASCKNLKKRRIRWNDTWYWRRADKL